MKVLIGCEFSQIVTRSFREHGHEAYSCDLLPTEGDNRWHIQCDVCDVLMPCAICEGAGELWPNNYLLHSRTPNRCDACKGTRNAHGWDLAIFHPPCTYLAVSGARWFKDRRPEQEDALVFVQMLANAPIDRICIENPVSVLSTRWRKPDQIIQPWQFSHHETKATCLWLKNLPKLQPTNVVEGRTPRVHCASPGPDRWKERSRTLQGIADAMADQWGGHCA